MAAEDWIGGEMPPWLEEDDPFEEEDEMPQQPQRGDKQPYKHKTNRGSMFDNDRKTKETQPDFTGTIDVEGKVYWINGWTGMTTNNKRKISLSVQVQEERHPNERHEENGWGGNLPQRQQQRREVKW